MIISRRAKVTALLVLLLLALLLGGFFLWRLVPSRTPAPSVPVIDPTPEPNEPARTPERANSAPTVVEGDRTATFSIQSLAKTFTERFGSYSTEADFANLRDVLPLMSASYAGQTQAYLATAVSPSEYYGVTTRIVSIKVLSSDEAAGTASLDVSTQREEAKGSVQNVSVRYQTLHLSLLKENNAWKVDTATWE